MNEIKISSGNNERTIIKDGIEWVEYDFYKMMTRDNEYKINLDDYNRIKESIRIGAKFIELNEDLINVNEIKMFKKMTDKKLPNN